MAEYTEIYVGGCSIKWVGAKLDTTGVYLDGDDAVEFSIYESDLDNDNDNGAVVTGADGVALSYIADSSGLFIGPLLASASLVRDSFYWLEVTATPSGGSPHTRRFLVKAVDRGASP